MPLGKPCQTLVRHKEGQMGEENCPIDSPRGGAEWERLRSQAATELRPEGYMAGKGPLARGHPLSLPSKEGNGEQATGGTTGNRRKGCKRGRGPLMSIAQRQRGIQRV